MCLKQASKQKITMLKNKTQFISLLLISNIICKNIIRKRKIIHFYRNKALSNFENIFAFPRHFFQNRLINILIIIKHI